MFDEVPDPVWNTSTGNWSSWEPAATASAAVSDRYRERRVEQPEIGVHRGGRRLDAAEPVHHARWDRLAGDREVLHGLGGLGPPQRCVVHTPVLPAASDPKTVGDRTRLTRVRDQSPNRVGAWHADTRLAAAHPPHARATSDADTRTDPRTGPPAPDSSARSDPTGAAAAAHPRTRPDTAAALARAAATPSSEPRQPAACGMGHAPLTFAQGRDGQSSPCAHIRRCAPRPRGLNSEWRSAIMTSTARSITPTTASSRSWWVCSRPTARPRRPSTD